MGPKGRRPRQSQKRKGGGKKLGHCGSKCASDKKKTFRIPRNSFEQTGG